MIDSSQKIKFYFSVIEQFYTDYGELVLGDDIIHLVQCSAIMELNIIRINF